MPVTMPLLKFKHNFNKEYALKKRLRIGVLFDDNFNEYNIVNNWLNTFGDVQLIMANKFYPLDLIVLPDICPYVRHLQINSISHSATKFSDLEMHKRYADAGIPVIFTGRSALIPISEIDDMEKHITPKYLDYSSFFPVVSEGEIFLQNGVFSSYRDHLFTVKDSIQEEGFKIESYRTYKKMTTNIVESYSLPKIYGTFGVPYKVNHLDGSFIKSTFNFSCGDFLTNKTILSYAKEI